MLLAAPKSVAPPRIANRKTHRVRFAAAFSPFYHPVSDVSISETVQNVSSAYIQEVWKKALDRRATDPEGAITSARTLLESVCKHILDAKSMPYDDSQRKARRCQGRCGGGIQVAHS